MEHSGSAFAESLREIKHFEDCNNVNFRSQIESVKHPSLHGFPRWPDHFFLVNRVENQNEPKQPQSGRLGSFWFSTRPTAMGGTDNNAVGLWDNLRSRSSVCPIF